jgi:hypothetical protein
MKKKNIAKKAILSKTLLEEKEKFSYLGEYINMPLFVHGMNLHRK